MNWIWSLDAEKKKKKNSLSLYQILNAKRERERLFERALIKG